MSKHLLFQSWISKAFILKTPHAGPEDQRSFSAAQTTQHGPKIAQKESLGAIKQFSPAPLISLIADSIGNPAGIPFILSCKTQGEEKKMQFN